MDLTDYETNLCNALNVDFAKLKEACQAKKANVSGSNSITILTGSNYALTLDISDREWFVDDGCGDFPPGEIYIAPKETKSNRNLPYCAWYESSFWRNKQLPFPHGFCI